jgi:hypothetical protein
MTPVFDRVVEDRATEMYCPQPYDVGTVESDPADRAMQRHEWRLQQLTFLVAANPVTAGLVGTQQQAGMRQDTIFYCIFCRAVTRVAVGAQAEGDNGVSGQ